MRGNTRTYSLWRPTSLNLANGSLYWAKNDNTVVQSTNIPADAAHWFPVECDAYDYATLTFYSRIATITSQSGTGGIGLRPFCKGMAYRPGQGHTFPVLTPPECGGESYAHTSIIAQRNGLALIRTNGADAQNSAYQIGDGTIFLDDFLMRAGTAAAVDQQEMEQAFVVPLNQSDEPSTTQISFMGDSRKLVPFGKLWFAFMLTPTRSQNATYHADTGIYLTLTREGR